VALLALIDREVSEVFHQGAMHAAHACSTLRALAHSALFIAQFADPDKPRHNKEIVFRL
jgi:hypothetical protein